ncbi:hypothetical protein BJV82DRAFT_625065 [Fennellomyces sp. T-0311]|nr:hypothetical protein BJV82DRAFT_625065 [Fennellomyces sp. T-0311]
MTTIDVTGPLPGVNRVYTFPDWRYSPTEDTLMFNFKSVVLTEEEGLDVVSQKYGLSNIVSARQLKYPAVLAMGWVILEVLFKTPETRKEALRNGIKYRKKEFMPFTTCTQVFPCTVVSFFGMPLQSDRDAITFAATRALNFLTNSARRDTGNNMCEDNLVSGRAAIKVGNNAPGTVATTGNFQRGGNHGAAAFVNSATIRTTSTASNSNGNISTGTHCSIEGSHVWLQRNSYGIFNGGATVVADGFDDFMAEKKNGSLAYFVAAPEYPLLEILVRRCQMYCTKCRTLNHHKTDDCTGVFFEKLHDPNDHSQIYDDKVPEEVEDKDLWSEEDSDVDPDYTYVEPSASETDSDDSENGMDSETSPRRQSV